MYTHLNPPSPRIRPNYATASHGCCTLMVNNSKYLTQISCINMYAVIKALQISLKLNIQLVTRTIPIIQIPFSYKFLKKNLIF